LPEGKRAKGKRKKEEAAAHSGFAFSLLCFAFFPSLLCLFPFFALPFCLPRAGG
jgi:hypothetical protein